MQTMFQYDPLYQNVCFPSSLLQFSSLNLLSPSLVPCYDKVSSVDQNQGIFSQALCYSLVNFLYIKYIFEVILYLSHSFQLISLIRVLQIYPCSSKLHDYIQVIFYGLDVLQFLYSNTCYWTSGSSHIFVIVNTPIEHRKQMSFPNSVQTWNRFQKQTSGLYGSSILFWQVSKCLSQSTFAPVMGNPCQNQAIFIFDMCQF